MPVKSHHPWRRRRLAEWETILPLEPEVASFEAADRLGSPEAEVGSVPPGGQGAKPLDGARPGHHRQHPQEEARP